MMKKTTIILLLSILVIFGWTLMKMSVEDQGSSTEQIQPPQATLPFWQELKSEISGYLFLSSDQAYFLLDVAGNISLEIPLVPGTTAAVISPDGRQVIYWEGGFFYLFDLETMSVAQVNQDLVGSWGDKLVWSPDGTEIYFSCLPSDRMNAEICGLEINTGDYDVLTNIRAFAGKDVFVDASPGSLSYDGGTLFYIFSVGLPGGRDVSNSIHLLNMETGHVQVLLEEKDHAFVNPYQPLIAPDGRSLLFQALVEGVREVILLDIASGEYRQITTAANEYGISLSAWGPQSLGFFGAVGRLDKNGQLISVPTFFNLDGTILHQFEELDGWIVGWYR